MQHDEFFNALSADMESLETEILLLEEQPEDAALVCRILEALGLNAPVWAGQQTRELVASLMEGRLAPDQSTVDAFLGVVEAIKRLFYQAGVNASDKGSGPATSFEESPAASQEPAGTAGESEAAPAPPESEPPQDQAARKPREQTYIKVDTRKLDELMESVQELVISSTMMGQILQRAAAGDARSDAHSSGEMLEHERCIEAIRRQVLDIRKVNLRATCTRMARLVREVAESVDKQAELTAAGQDLELDKSVLDDLADPLIHLLRNAVDHGIESPEEREALGKPRKGSIQLEALQQGKEFVLRISDDGRGLNRQRILAKARERGLAQPGKSVDDYGEAELFGLIMQPGFSTAEQVSNVSGRGVGMDVVAQSLRAMQGELEIRSREGRGSRFTIRVPADRASLEGITQGVLVEVGGQHYVLRSGCVREVFRPAPGSVHTLAQEGEVVATREGSVSFYRLHCLLGVDPRNPEPENGLALLLEAGKEKLALQVDDVLGERQVVVRSFAGMDVFLGGTLFSGVAFIGSMTAMILDADAFLRTAREDNQYLCCRFSVCCAEEVT